MNHGGEGADAARAGDAFGAGLYRVLAGVPDAGNDAGNAGNAGNMVFSPASIAAALQMALLGARGETAAELARALHLSGPEMAAAGLRLLGGVLGESLRAASAAGSEDFTFRAPNTMWVQSGLPVRPEFLPGITDAGAAAVYDADFVHESEKARNEINRVIAEQTAGKIRDLIAPGVLGELTRLVLANAIYLKAAWATRFPAGTTAETPFHLTPGSSADEAGETVQVPMMHLTANLGYRRADGYQVVLLPYADVPLAMAVVLPDGPLGPVSKRLTGSGLRGLLSGVQSARVQLSMPRFRITSQPGLKPALERLGVRLAFDPDLADFTGITAAQKLYVSHVLHKAYIDVDENGTEAAAATAVMARSIAYRVEPQPVIVTVDRPFLFAVTETATGVALFLGRVANPAAG